MSLVRLLFAFFVAVAATFIVASVAHSHFVIRRLLDLGVDMPYDMALAMTTDDLVGLAPTLLPVVAVALLLGFLVAAIIRRWLPALAPIAYPVAGFAAMATMLAAMHAVYDITPIAGARDWAGWLAICLAGLLGGALFALLTKRKMT